MKKPKKGKSSSKGKLAQDFIKSLPEARAESLSPENLTYCSNCQTNLKTSEQALYVEEEVGSVFCSEDCIDLKKTI
jgi:hypothetical protein